MSNNLHHWLKNPDFAAAYKGPRPVSEPKAKKPVKVMPLPPPRREGDVLIITMPIPPRSLNPNGRSHWSIKRKVTQAFREQAALLTRVVSRGERWDAAHIDVTLWGPRQHDCDNLISSCKGIFDGVSESLQCNDKHFTIGAVTQYVGKASEGKRQVQITITRTAI